MFARRVPVCAVLLAVAAALPARADWIVDVELVDGTRLRGATTLERVVVTTEVGELEVTLEVGHVLSFEGTSPEVRTHASSLRGKLAPAEIPFRSYLGSFSLGRDRLRRLVVVERATEPSAAKRDPSNAPEPSKPAEPINEVRPDAVVRVGSLVRDLALTSRGLVFFDASRGCLRRLRTKDRVLDDLSVELPAGTRGVRTSPSGTTLYAFAAPRGHDRFADPAARQEGVFQVVDADTLSTRIRFAADVDPWDLAADDRGRLYVSAGSGQRPEIAVIDIGRKSVVARWTQAPTTRLRLAVHRQGARIYGLSSSISPGEAYCAPLPSDPTREPKFVDSRYHGEFPLEHASFAITPDGHFLVATTGVVLRLSNDAREDLVHHASIEPHLAAAVDPARRVLIAAVEMSEIFFYQLPDFRPMGSLSIGVALHDLACDAGGKTLYAAGGSPQFGGSPAERPADLYVFDLPPLYERIRRTEEIATGPGPTAGIPPEEALLVDESQPIVDPGWSGEVLRDQPCPVCDRRGTVVLELGREGAARLRVEARCGACLGAGIVDLVGCAACRATGQVYRSATATSGSGSVFVDGQVACARCAATGYVPDGKIARGLREGKSRVTCPHCGGGKKVRVIATNPTESTTVTLDCPTCAGRGMARVLRCDRCKGGGSVASSRSVLLGSESVHVNLTHICPGCGGLGVRFEAEGGK